MCCVLSPRSTTSFVVCRKCDCDGGVGVTGDFVAGNGILHGFLSVPERRVLVTSSPSRQQERSVENAVAMTFLGVKSQVQASKAVKKNRSFS